MDRLRAQYGRRDDDADLPDIAAEPDDLALGVDVERGLAALPLIEREVLTLFHIEQFTLADIAQALGVPVGTVKSRLFRARALLRAHVQPEERDDAL